MGRVLKAGELKSKPTSISKEAIEAARMLVEAKRAAYRIREEARDDVIELAVHMAKRIVGRTVELNPAVLDDMYSEALRSAGELKKAVIRVHPADREVSNIDELASGAGFEVSSDPSIERAGCRISAGGAEVDATTSSALELFRDAMKGTHIGGN